MDSKLQNLREAMDSTTHKGDHFTDEQKNIIRKRVRTGGNMKNKKPYRFIISGAVAAITIFVLLVTTEFLYTGNDTQYSPGGVSDNDYDITGRNLGADQTEMLIFVEDNIGGERVVNAPQENFDATDYEVEAYKAQITNETKIIRDDTKEEVTFWESYLSVMRGQPVKVNVVEDFKKEVSTDRSGYINYSSEFLPVYQASEVRLLEPSFDDFNFYMQTLLMPMMGSGENGFHIIFTGGETGENIQFSLEEANEDLEAYRSTDRSIEVTNSTMRIGGDYYPNMNLQELLQKYNIPEEYMESTFLIYDSHGLVTNKDEWVDVLRFFEEQDE